MWFWEDYLMSLLDMMLKIPINYKLWQDFNFSFECHHQEKKTKSKFMTKHSPVDKKGDNVQQNCA